MKMKISTLNWDSEARKHWESQKVFDIDMALVVRLENTDENSCMIHSCLIKGKVCNSLTDKMELTKNSI